MVAMQLHIGLNLSPPRDLGSTTTSTILPEGPYPIRPGSKFLGLPDPVLPNKLWSAFVVSWKTTTSLNSKFRGLVTPAISRQLHEQQTINSRQQYISSTIAAQKHAAKPANKQHVKYNKEGQNN
ncbi:hypothetical protein EVAR_64981_1 [Eumeta japonica]|uniref:Uncharacterized protein n=1 Tax=Eumeta variegata TaxID=151549 RepID=A0A4C1ZV48_EUMVA|nr:hypothetical protein EVAR_64981_1 [Eumeta japonica]